MGRSFSSQTIIFPIPNLSRIGFTLSNRDWEIEITLVVNQYTFNAYKDIEKKLIVSLFWLLLKLSGCVNYFFLQVVNVPNL